MVILVGIDLIKPKRKSNVFSQKDNNPFTFTLEYEHNTCKR